MRPSKTLVAGLLSLSLLTAACGDDTVDTGAPDTTASPGVEVPDRPADLTGTITSVTPFVPITEDCTPAEDLPPDGTVSSDDPPVCTPVDNDVVGSITVEENPDDPEGGRRIAYTVTTDTTIAGSSAPGTSVDAFADLAVGQTAVTWVAGGMCAESYPEQCGLEAIRVIG